MSHIQDRMRALAESTAKGYGASVNFEFRDIFHPVVNDEAQSAFAAAVCTDLVGKDNVHVNLPPGTGSEDFSFMLEQVPGCYLLIGNGDGDERHPVHHPSYDFNDDASVYGATFFAELTEQRLQSSTPDS